jgi:hypothetical protein
MISVTISRDAKLKLDNFAEQDKREVQEWCKELREWRFESPRFLSRTNGLELGGREKKRLYVLKTDSDIRLVFTESVDGITVTDILPSSAVNQRTLDKARKSRKMKTAQAS